MRKLLGIAAFFLLAAGLVAARAFDGPAGTPEASAVDTPSVTVYKSPTCGCCGAWVDHLEAEGFEVKVSDMPDVGPMKRHLGVPGELHSCHTAVVDGYVVEGHVPADDIRRLLAERPDVTGLAVPGMPIGSPGMEVPGRDPHAYDVVAFTKDGQRTVFAQH